MARAISKLRSAQKKKALFAWRTLSRIILLREKNIITERFIQYAGTNENAMHTDWNILQRYFFSLFPFPREIISKTTARADMTFYSVYVRTHN